MAGTATHSARSASRGPERLAARTGIAASCAHRILRHHLVRSGRPRQGYRRTRRRDERNRPDELVHIGVKKFGRIPDGGGHKVLGRAAGWPTRTGATAPVSSTCTPHWMTATPAWPTPKARTAAPMDSPSTVVEGESGQLRRQKAERRYEFGVVSAGGRLE